MHVCMVMLKNIEYNDEVKPTMLDSRVTTPFGKDYGFKLHL